MKSIVDLVPVHEEDKLVLRNLLNLYLYDLSEYKQSDVNCHGYFEYRRLDQYWYDDNCHAFFITASGRVAGFVLVHRYDLLKQNRNVISEFFVMRKYRKLGLGREAAFQVFQRFPGGWEVSQLPENLPSQHFWRKVITEFTSGHYKETLLDNRPVQYFEH